MECKFISSAPQLIPGCSTCGFSLFNPVAELQVSNLGIYSDARFPGRSILALRDHQEHLEDMDEWLLTQFMLDAQNAIQAIKKATGVERVNFAVLGNTESHVHAHLIPRYPNTEMFPNSSPWNDLREKKTLEPDILHDLTRNLQEAVQS